MIDSRLYLGLGSFAAVLAAAACNSSPTAPQSADTAALTASVGNAERRPIATATGAGHFLQGTALRTFSFSAALRADGTATGQAEGFRRYGGLPVHLVVTCASISGNRAWIGGRVVTEKNPAFPNTGGFMVIDGGEGAGAVDRISFFWNDPDPAWGQRICDEQLEFGSVAIQRGNIQVRSRSG